MSTDLSIVLLTYNRKEYAERTLRSTLENICCSGRLHVHLADDGTGGEYLEWLHDVANEYVPDKSITTSDSERGGYGKNYNLAMQVAHVESQLILPLEDDWVLTRPLNVDLMHAAMQDLDIGCLRLGYIGYTQPLAGTLKYSECIHQHFLQFDPDSPEPHVFAGHPRFETVEWSRSVGPWPENYQPGQTEFVVAHRAASRSRVFWPLDYVPPSGGLFAHIGTVRSY